MEAHVEQTESAVWTGPAGVKLIIGAFLALLGLVMTLDNLGVIDGETFYRYWSVVLIPIGALKLARGGSRFWGIALVVAGAWLLAWNLEWLRVSIFDFWPLLLIAGGVAMVAGALGFRLQPRTTAAGMIWATLAHRKIVETSQDFRGASLVAFMGGCTLDLTQADISSGPAIIDATATWGGIEIFVPDSWEVAGEVVPVMGGFEMKLGTPERRAEGDLGRRQLIVRGVAFMGGIEVKNASRRTA
jgi:Cell wall-active antibiotics response 4TMS YvqF/Domain of unknown function (DUF5668)